MVKKVIDCIVEYAQPEAIILFGSRARGDYKEDSDYDLLIVKDKITNKSKLIGDLYTEFFKNRVNVAVDLLAVEKEKYIQHRNTIGLVYGEIHKEGKVVYGTL